MTYLQLINQVLIRLREDTITAGTVDIDPYYRSIGAHVNDAKDRVEDAWQWGALRGTDVVDLTGGIYAEMPNSSDSNFILKRMFSSMQYDPMGTSIPALTTMTQTSVDGMRKRYQGGSDSVAPAQPQEFAFTGRNSATGNIQITVFPPAPTGSIYSLTVDRVAHQPTLTDPNDELLVPSLPVYTLATALASRERGEVGGTPTSELFAIADRHLSDAIATNTALYPDEMVWYGGIDRPWRTNIRTA